jgi:phosphoribosylanthranilate isomerase
MAKVKICGIKTLRDARMAAEAGADMLGFNFHPKSPRYIESEACTRITTALRREYPSLELVGVFVNASPVNMRRTLADCSLDLAQLSGDEPPEVWASLAGAAFKAFHGVPSNEVRQFVRQAAPAFLVDGHATGAYGGTGIATDWGAAAALARDYPLLLAGGLTAENVAQAIRQVRPWGVDVASGVESRPGEKEPDKIRAFLSAVRAAEA